MKSKVLLSEIAAYLNVELRGDPLLQIVGLNTLKEAREGEIAFLANPKYVKDLPSCKASAVILSVQDAEYFSGHCLVTDHPYLAYARLSAMFDRVSNYKNTTHPSATINPSAIIAADVYIGPNVVIEAGVQIGSGCQIHANSVIAENSSIGEDGYLAANVTIYHNVKIGDRVRVHSSSVLGADGFGIAPRGDGSWQKIHQIGGVSIGDDVEIGACSTIDRGALQDTIIGNGVKIDNHVQIAHNAVVGDNTAMAAYSGLAGSAKVGKNCILGGDACIVGHVIVCDNVMLTARTLVTKSISKPGSYSSGSTPLMSSREWRKNSVRIGQLDKLARRVDKIEK